MWLQNQWRLRPLTKIEAVEHIVCGGIPGCKASKVIPRLDELQHRGMFVESVADISRLGKGGNDEQRHSRTQTILIQLRRRNVVVESSEVVIGYKYGRGVSCGTLDNGIDDLRGLIVPCADAIRRMFASLSSRSGKVMKSKQGTAPSDYHGRR
jgi:hypothetical protein